MLRLFVFAFALLPMALLAQANDAHFVLKGDSSIYSDSRAERYLALLDEATVIEGSMYLSDDFIQGLVLLRSQRVMSDLFLRYNVFRDQMEMVDNHDTMVLVSPDQTQWLGLGKQKFCWLPFENHREVDSGYFEVLVEGYYRLLVRRVRLFEPSNPPYTLMHLGNEYDRFVPLEFLYVQVGDAPAQKLKRSSRRLVSLFGDDCTLVRNFIRKNKLNLRKKSDAEQLIRYCNSLSELSASVLPLNH